MMINLYWKNLAEEEKNMIGHVCFFDPINTIMLLQTEVAAMYLD
jgi:hypothetical protein